MWRSNVVMYVTVPYNEVLFSILYFLNQPKGGWNGIALVWARDLNKSSLRRYKTFQWRNDGSNLKKKNESPTFKWPLTHKLFLCSAGKKHNPYTSHQWKDVNSSSPHENNQFHNSKEFTTHNHNILAYTSVAVKMWDKFHIFRKMNKRQTF
jgi:hypothetical protein